VLPSEEREAYERQANGAKERYYAELADYKKTPQHDAYQKYLEDFRAKHAVPSKGQSYLHTVHLSTKLTYVEGKRSKLEPETHTSVRSNNNDQYDREPNRRLSSTQPEASTAGRQSSETSPATCTACLPIGVSSFSSKTTSPASLPLTTFNSSNTGDYYSPISASPRSAMFDPIIVPQDLRSLQDPEIVHHSNAFIPSSHQAASTTPPSYPHVSHFQNPQDSLPRRSMRDNIRLPPLSHEDTTLSSESGHSGSGYNFSLASYPDAVLPLDPTKTSRLLPQPVLSIGPSPSAFDRQLVPVLSPHVSSQPPDYRTQGSLAALVRAGELASRNVEDKAMDMEHSL
jgi:hypothetical protein